MKKERIASNVIEFFIAVSFVMNVFANVISFYLTGNKNDQIRKIISHGIIVGSVLVLALYAFLKLIRSDRESRKKIFFCVLPLAIMMLLCVGGGLRTRGRKDLMIHLLACCSYSLPLVCGAVYIMAENRFEHVVHKIKYVAVMLTPYWGMALCCYWKLKFDVDSLADYGGILYLSVGYSATIIYSFLIYDLRLYFYPKKSNRISLGLIFGEMALCSTMVIMSGGRGPLISWVVVNITAFILQLIYKERKVIGGIFFSIMVVVIVCIAVPSDNAALNRQFSFLQGKESDDLKQTVTSEAAKEFLEKLYSESEAEGGMKEVTVKAQKESERHTTGNMDEIASEKTTEMEEIINSVLSGSMSRSYLWQLAIKEVQQRPLRGMGPLGFQIKYQTYPHNILLECMADFGIPVFILFVGACGVIIIVLFRRSGRVSMYRGLIIILSGQAVLAMISGCFYTFEFLMFAAVIVIWNLYDNRGYRKKNNQKNAFG